MPAIDEKTIERLPESSGSSMAFRCSLARERHNLRVFTMTSFDDSRMTIVKQSNDSAASGNDS